MPTNPGQGNTQGPPYASGQYTNVYVYSTVVSPIVGTQFFFNSTQGATAPAGTYKIFVDNVWKTFTVNTGGVVTAVNTCSWSSVQYYSAPYTSYKNDCSGGSCSVSGSTVNLNDGNPANAYSGSGTATSYVSQADADAIALANAQAAFDAGKQAKVNELGYCTWTYNSGSAYYEQTYTRNNCAANCYGTNWTTSSSKSGYSAQSTVSCQDAINTANSSAYNAAVSAVQSVGQSNANANGSCCCWVSDPACVAGTCNYMGDRQRNTCTGEYRYTNYTSTASCNCGETCASSYFEYSCGGQYSYDRYRQEKWTCTNNIKTANALYESCSASCNANSSPVYEYQSYSTCYNCNNVAVYKDVNHCSGTNGAYYVYSGGYVYVGSQPSGVACNTDSQCVDTGSAYCSGGNYVINRTQGNACSGASCSSPRVIEYNSTTYGCYTPPTCKLYELYMYGGYSEYVYVTYSVCGGGAATMSAYNDGGGGYGGQVCAVQGTAYISSGSGSLIDQGSCNNT